MGPLPLEAETIDNCIEHTRSRTMYQSVLSPLALHGAEDCQAMHSGMKDKYGGGGFDDEEHAMHSGYLEAVAPAPHRQLRHPAAGPGEACDCPMRPLMLCSEPYLKSSCPHFSSLVKRCEFN